MAAEFSQQTPLQTTPGPDVSPKSVKVDMTGGSGMAIEWKDGHKSHFTFVWLRDACPCAKCDEVREKEGRTPGQPEKAAPGALPMFKPPVKPTDAAAVGKYAIRFSFNDGHQHGIYSWEFLRQWCPCRECSSLRAANKPEPGATVQ